MQAVGDAHRIRAAEGQRQDLVRFLNKELLLAQWPVLRRMVSRHLGQVWEEAFPALTQAAVIAERGQPT